MIFVFWLNFAKFLQKSEVATHTMENQWGRFSIEIISLKINSHAGSMLPQIEW